MLLGRSRILYVGPGTLRIAFRRVPRAPMAPHRLLGGYQSCSQALATLPTCMPWGWVGLEATAELPVSSEEGQTVREMFKCQRDDEGRGRTTEADCVPQLAIWWYLKHGIAMELGRLRSYTHWQLSCSLVVPCVWSTFVLSAHRLREMQFGRAPRASGVHTLANSGNRSKGCMTRSSYYTEA